MPGFTVGAVNAAPNGTIEKINGLLVVFQSRGDDVAIEPIGSTNLLSQLASVLPCCLLVQRLGELFCPLTTQTEPQCLLMFAALLLDSIELIELLLFERRQGAQALSIGHALSEAVGFRIERFSERLQQGLLLDNQFSWRHAKFLK
jgi:hypothetical protein